VDIPVRLPMGRHSADMALAMGIGGTKPLFYRLLSRKPVERILFAMEHGEFPC
jgi:hypothetical protein